MVKVDLITGFLGSGKTTFLLKYAKHLIDAGNKIGILEYDYGAVNVDMLMLNSLRGANCELEMIAAACDEDCLRRRFKTKLIAMAMSGYQRVIIEPSGVFDMDMFFDALREEPLERWYEIGNIITIVNANLQEEANKETDYLLASQAADAGCVVLSRTQLTDEEHVANTKRRMREALETIHCRDVQKRFIEKDWELFDETDYQFFETCGYKKNDYQKSIAGDALSYDSVSFLNPAGSVEDMKEKISKMFQSDEYGHIIRAKGFVREDGPCYEINATRQAITTRILSGRNVMTVIGTNLNKEKIQELITGK